jgi:uncharacterized protein
LTKVELVHKIQMSRDVKDDYLLSFSVDGNIDFLVTGDVDLLILEQVGQMKIVNMNTFNAILSEFNLK